jgi:predicted GNAT family acetyltransferase
MRIDLTPRRRGINAHPRRVDSSEMNMSALRNNRELSRYELDEQGSTAFADYRLQGERLYLDYVFAPPELRGSGTAGRLMAAVASEARDKGLKITPICGYAAAWLRRSHEFRDLVG